MISLKIDQPGFTVTIPGLQSFRSPAIVDISRVDIRIVIMYLKTAGIIDYHIIAEKDKEIEVYTGADFEELHRERKSIKPDPNLENRFERIEKLLLTLIDEKKSSNSELDLEQINIKLKSIENSFKTLPKSKLSNGTLIIEELDEIQSFIPKIDISDMKMKGQNMRTIKQEDGIDDSANALAFLQTTRGKK